MRKILGRAPTPFSIVGYNILRRDIFGSKYRVSLLAERSTAVVHVASHRPVMCDDAPGSRLRTLQLHRLVCCALAGGEGAGGVETSHSQRE